MNSLTLLLLALTACRPKTDESPSISADTSSEKVPGLSDAETTDTSPEQIPSDTNTSSLCRVFMDCKEAIPPDPRVPCNLRVESGTGEVVYDGLAGVHLRGRSSVSFPKPQYSVELWEEYDVQREQDLFGMGPEDDWVLNGVYIDRALFRNALCYDLFQSFGGKERYAAESRFCELTLNGTWMGIFTFGESIRHNDSRVDISRDENEQGRSFIVKNDDRGGGFMTADAVQGEWILEYPKQEEASPAELATTWAYITRWQQAVLGDDPFNPETGIWAYLDMDSTVDFVIIEELSKNIDGYALSVHLWKDLDTKMYFAPWDMDLTFGYPRTDCGVKYWVRELNAFPFMTIIAQDPAFEERLQARWFALRQDQLSDQALLDRIATYREILGDTVYANFDDDLWPIDQIDFCYGGECYLCPIKTYDEEYERFRGWIVDRTAWMDANITDF